MKHKDASKYERSENISKYKQASEGEAAVQLGSGNFMSEMGQRRTLVTVLFQVVSICHHDMPTFLNIVLIDSYMLLSTKYMYPNYIITYNYTS